MSLLRAFIACELPLSIQDEIQKAASGLCKGLGNDLVRWVPWHNIHLTLKFLGEVSPSNLDMLKQIMTREAAQHSAFDVQIENLGSYPNPRRPRVIWVGLNAPASLFSLQHAIETATAKLGYETEEREFSPHLTIGRVRQNVSNADLQKIRTSLEATKIGKIGTISVNEIHLYKSDLQPAGSVYTKLFSAPLGKLQ